jgi:hypothetical protein
VLRGVAESGLLKGQMIDIDATTLEANGALRSLVRRETGQGYQEFLLSGWRGSRGSPRRPGKICGGWIGCGQARDRMRSGTPA